MLQIQCRFQIGASGTPVPASTSIWASCCFWFAASDLKPGSLADRGGEAAGGNLYRPDAEFDSKGVRIAFFDTGPGVLGETVMLIHGWTTSSRMWMEMPPFTVRIVGPLVDAGFRVIGMDMRGHGTVAWARSPAMHGQTSFFLLFFPPPFFFFFFFPPPFFLNLLLGSRI